MGVWGWGAGIIPHYSSEGAVHCPAQTLSSCFIPPLSPRIPAWGGQRGHNLEEKLGVARGHMHLRSCIQSAIGYYIHILWSCVITVHPRCTYPVCATQGEGHGLVPTPCSLPGVSACLLPSPLLPYTPELPFQLTLEWPPNIELSSHPIHILALLYVKHWRVRQKPRRHGFCTKCKYVGVMYKCARTYPSHAGTADHEECCRESMKGQGYTRMKVNCFC